MSDKIILTAQLTGFTPRKDKTLSLRFNTQEYSEEQLIRVNRMLDQMGFVCFKTDERFTSDEMNDLDAIDVDILDKTKSPSKRLRSTLYVLWECSRKADGISFKEYYSMTMEKMITHYKDQIID